MLTFEKGLAVMRLFYRSTDEAAGGSSLWAWRDKVDAPLALLAGD
ncbi:MAG: hypothetical protein QHC40_00005 [Sphingobium sp.]|nr:hypothetical protein [Sphingobium sp.]